MMTSSATLGVTPQFAAQRMLTEYNDYARDAGKRRVRSFEELEAVSSADPKDELAKSLLVRRAMETLPSSTDKRLADSYQNIYEVRRADAQARMAESLKQLNEWNAKEQQRIKEENDKLREQYSSLYGRPNYDASRTRKRLHRTIRRLSDLR